MTERSRSQFFRREYFLGLLKKLKAMNKGFMYILQCSDGTYYTGSTKEIEKRMQEHQSGVGENIRQEDYQLNCYILKNFKELMKLSIERNKYKVGVGKRRKH